MRSVDLVSSRKRAVEFAELLIPKSKSSATVVALHCSGSNYKQWEALGNALQREENLACRLVAPNLFGSGRTDPWGDQPMRPMTLDDQAALVEACVDETEDVYLVGHSHGGSVGLRYANRGVAGLVLFEPNCFFLGEAAGQSEDKWIDALAFVECLKIAAEKGDRNELGKLFWEFWFGDRPWDDLDQRKKDRLIEATMSTTYHEVISLLMARGTSTPGDLATLAALADTTHLIHSPEPGKGVAYVLSQQRNLFERLGCAFHVASGGNHLAPINHADATARQIVDCLLDCAARHGN